MSQDPGPQGQPGQAPYGQQPGQDGPSQQYQAGGQPGPGGSYGHQPYPPHGYPQQQGGGDDKMWAMFSHLGGLLGIFVSGGVLGIVAPLVILLTKGTTSAFVRRHAAAALNFQITLLIVAVAGVVIGAVATILTLGIALLVLIPAALLYAGFALVVMILATIRANNGEEYRYPLSFRFVS